MGPVVVLRIRDAVGLDRLRVDLRGEEVVDARAIRPRAVERAVDRVLVGPSRPHAGAVDDLEDRVHLQVVPRHDRLACRRIDRERGGVQTRLRVRGQIHDRGRVRIDAGRVDRAGLVEGRERVAAAEKVRHGAERVVRRVVDRVAARNRTRTVGGARREHRVVVGDVVVHARRAWIATGHQGRPARIRVRRIGCVRVAELGSAMNQLCQLGARVVSHEPLEIGLVQPVHRDQQDVLEGRLPARRGNRHRDRCRSHPGRDQTEK